MHAALMLLLALGSEGRTTPQRTGAEAAGPPGLVWIAGGATTIGSRVKDIEAIGRERETDFPTLVCETPEQSINVADFWLMVTETTNEQYEAYVRAAGIRPPESWGQKTIDDASEQFAKDYQRRVQLAKDTGQTLPPAETFDRAHWWTENWQHQAWSVPDGQATAPVVYVEYSDVLGYARWAGLRPMTEFEFQRAGRGKTRNVYPWGNNWDDSRAVAQSMHLGKPMVVGSVPSGATPEGVFDLTGNCWEWTSSPFTPYTGYRDLQIVVGAGRLEHKVDALTRWDPARLVIVGGCFLSSALEARLTTRRNAEKHQATAALGFRCALSGEAGLDLARTILERDLPPNLRPPAVNYDATRSAWLDRWMSLPGKQPVANYAVITAYDYITFIPAIDLDGSTAKELKAQSVERGPVHLGVLATTRAVHVPKLAPGVYMVAFRAAGQRSAKPDDKDAAAREPNYPSDFDFRSDQLLFFDNGGALAGSAPGPAVEYLRPAEPEIAIEAPAEADAVVSLKVCSFAKVPGRSFNFTLKFGFEAKELGEGWRHR
jgi:formylglycine-generating enzyme required for sulfatase activity